jgi:hypothetical protein
MENFYYYSEVREYFIEEISRFGYTFTKLINFDIQDCLSKNLIWDEHNLNIILKNFDVLKLTDKKNYIIVDDDYRFLNQMSELDRLCEGKKNFAFISLRKINNTYKNINCYSLKLTDLWCHHDIIKYLIDTWHKKRKNNTLDNFLCLSSSSLDNKDKRIIDRSQLHNKIKNLLGDNLFKKPTRSDVELYNNRDKFNSWMKQKFHNRNMLGGFGSGMPNFNFYDQVFGEIILETNYYEPVIHISEKTWKPIACKVPCILLLNKHEIEYLEEEGYKLYPTFLYKELKECENYDEVFETFKKFYNHFKNDNRVKEELKKMSTENFAHFWRHRSHWETASKELTKIFGYCPIDQIYDQLNSI